MLVLYRRHLTTGFGEDKKQPCPHSQDRYYRRCHCPVWIEGSLEGRYRRQSLKTPSWTRAEELKQGLEAPRTVERHISLSEAKLTFLDDIRARNLSSDVIRKYTLQLNQLEEYAALKRIHDLKDVSFETLVGFRTTWKEKSASTRLKKLERVRAFFRFCHNAGWIIKNPSLAIRPEKAPNASVAPFSPQEQAIILSAQTTKRTKAFIRVLHYAALRISDAVMLRPEHLDGDHICRPTQKNKKIVRIPIPPELTRLLQSLETNHGYFFLQGDSQYHPTQSDYWRGVLKEIFGAKIPDFHPHRFRHSATVNWLLAGLTIVEVAAYLGNSPRIVEKHYWQWCQAQQEKAEQLVRASWKPKLVRVK